MVIVSESNTKIEHQLYLIKYSGLNWPYRLGLVRLQHAPGYDTETHFTLLCESAQFGANVETIEEIL